MQIFELSYGGHQWEKQNLTTLGINKTYDLYKCKCCGIKGKSYHLGYITVRECDVKKMAKCCGKKRNRPTRLKVTRCNAFGKEFSQLIPGSIHDIISPPQGEDNSRGEWVQGVSEPVLLLSGEYEYLEE